MQSAQCINNCMSVILASNMKHFVVKLLKLSFHRTTLAAVNFMSIRIFYGQSK